MKTKQLKAGRQMVPCVERNSFVGELWAILMVLNSFRRATIYTDCQAVVDLVNEAIEGVPKDETYSATLATKGRR